MVAMEVNGRRCDVLVDTGCTDNIVFAGRCRQWTPLRVTISTMGGSTLGCLGVSQVTLSAGGSWVTLPALVMAVRPMGVDFVLGMDGISALGGVRVRSSTDVGLGQVCGAVSQHPTAGGAAERTDSGAAGRAAAASGAAGRAAADSGAAGRAAADSGAAGRAAADSGAAKPAVGGTEALTIDAKDFTASFDSSACAWTVAWKWTDGAGPSSLANHVPQYTVAASAREQYDEELESWLQNGWLQPYDERVLGPPRGLIPLMAVPQATKVRPVLDMRELNSHVAAYTADADVCSEHLRKWRRHGRRVAVVDLRRAYLQLRLDQRLWPYQTVIIRGKRYCLTRLGFGLNVAPSVMKAVVRAVLAQDPAMERAVSPYVDDLLVDEDQISAECVAEHFRRFGLECKQPARAEDGARLLGLRVQRARSGELRWSRDSDVPARPTRVTRRAVFAWCGRLTAHLPVCGWLRPAAAWLKRRVNAVTSGWDDVTDDPALHSQIGQVHDRLRGLDPACGSWCWTADRAIVWADASSIAAGVVIETPNDGVVEDACWLRSEHSSAQHINMAELDAAVRGLNLAVAWGAKEIELRTDSVTVHRWVDDAISGRTRLRTRAAGEILIRRRVGIIRQTVEEMGLQVTVTLVRSAENRADVLTRVPKDWVTAENRTEDMAAAVGAACRAENDSDVSRIREVHRRAGHPGVRRTLYFARRDVSRDVTRAAARSVVETCDTCRSIDPAPVRWRHGSLGVAVTWQRVAIDVTHHRGCSYLSIIDCGPSRFCLWRQLRRADATEITGHLEQLFLERGAPAELLADNDTVFRGRQVAALAARWRVALRFRAVHEPSGNGIVERCHRSVKVIAARRQCSISEAVHLYNVSPRDGEREETAPAAGVYTYTVRDCIRPAQTEEDQTDSSRMPLVSDGAQLRVGDRVWMRRRGTRCTEVSRRGRVTGAISRQVLEVDGVPWHVRDLRPRHVSASDSDDSGANSDGDSGANDSAPLWVDDANSRPAEDADHSPVAGPTGDAEERLGVSVDDPTIEADGDPRETNSPPLRRSERLRQAARLRRDL